MADEHNSMNVKNLIQPVYALFRLHALLVDETSCDGYYV